MFSNGEWYVAAEYVHCTEKTIRSTTKMALHLWAQVLFYFAALTLWSYYEKSEHACLFRFAEISCQLYLENGFVMWNTHIAWDFQNDHLSCFLQVRYNKRIKCVKTKCCIKKLQVELQPKFGSRKENYCLQISNRSLEK